MLFTVETLKILEESKKKRLMYRANNSVVSSVDFRGMGIEPTNKDTAEMSFTVGSLYSLTTPSCRGFKPITRIYQVVGELDEFNGVAISSIIAKQVSGPKVSMFSVSEAECEKYGVEFEENLMLLPKFLSWKRYFKKTVFTTDDLSTTPKSDKDGLIHQFLLRVTGFHDLPRGYVLSPSGKVVKEKDIQESLTITLKRPLVWHEGNSYSGALVAKEGTKFKGVIVYPKSKDFIFKNGNFIASDNSMYILVEDYMFGVKGIDPKYMEGIAANEHFEVSWDEAEALTVDEMKKKSETAKKAKEAKENAERQAIARMNAEISVATKKLEVALSKMDDKLHKIGIIQSDDPNLDGKFENLIKITEIPNIESIW